MTDADPKLETVTDALITLTLKPFVDGGPSYWLHDAMPPEARELTLDDIAEAVRILREQANKPRRICGIDTSHVVHPKARENGGWTICGNCWNALHIDAKTGLIDTLEELERTGTTRFRYGYPLKETT